MDHWAALRGRKIHRDFQSRREKQGWEMDCESRWMIEWEIAGDQQSHEVLSFSGKTQFRRQSSVWEKGEIDCR